MAECNSEVSLPPKKSNLQAEKEILSFLVWYSTDLMADAAINRLQPEYFTDTTNKKIFEAILALKRQGETPSLSVLTDYIQKLPQTDKYGYPIAKQPTVSDIAALGGERDTVVTSAIKKNIEILQANYKYNQLRLGVMSLTAVLKDPSVDIDNAVRDFKAKWEQAEEESDKADLLTLPTPESRKAEQQKATDDIETPYYFQTTGTNKEIEQLTLPSGAITFVCAPTSHGKSTFLQNLALYVAQNGKEGDTLYFTFEESKEAVDIQLTNKFINKPLSANNQRSISTYRRKSKDLFQKGQLKTYLDGEKRYLNELIYNGKLRLYEKDFDSTELIDAIKFLCKAITVKAVFIDYIQLLSKNGTHLQRNEELKEIAKDFKDLAKSTHIPIIMAAQLNRKATSPVDMHSENIAEAADLERIANKVILLWNSNFKEREKDATGNLKEWSSRTGVTLGEGGKIYALMAKNRGGIVGIEAVFTHHGNEGTIEQLMPTLQQVSEYKKEQGRTPEPQQADIFSGKDDITDEDPF